MAGIKIRKEGKSVLVGTLVPVGSRDELDSVKGVSHFLEHMMFKGTKTRSKNEITRAVEQYGAEFNAWTSEEHTFYYLTISSKYYDIAREIIDDMVHNSVFPSEEIDNERDVIFQELQMYQDNPRSSVFEEAQKVVFNNGSGLRLPIIGTKDTLNTINREILVDYYNKNYNKMIQVEVGDVEDNRNKVILPRKFTREALNFSKEDKIITRKGINQANMVFTGLIHKDNPHDNFTLNLLYGVLNGFQGRLFKTIREENHLVYNCGFFSQIYSCGTIQYWVYAALNADKINKAKELIKNELTRPVTEDEYTFSKNKTIGELELDLDNNKTVGKVIIESILNNDDYEDILTNYSSVDISLNTLNNFITKANFNDGKLVAIIPE